MACILLRAVGDRKDDVAEWLLSIGWGVGRLPGLNQLCLDTTPGVSHCDGGGVFFFSFPAMFLNHK